MTEISPNFDINKQRGRFYVQRGRFYVDADMLAANNACRMGYDEYVAAFGTERRAFNKTFIRKAIAKDLPMHWLARRSDTKYDTSVEDDFDELYLQWYDDSTNSTNWDQSVPHKMRTEWWIEAFEKNGYI